MLLSAVVHALGLTQLSPPGWLVILVQVVVGSIAGGRFAGVRWHEFAEIVYQSAAWAVLLVVCTVATAALVSGFRSEKHTSELQSLMRNSYAVFCLTNTPILQSI